MSHKLIALSIGLVLLAGLALTPTHGVRGQTPPASASPTPTPTPLPNKAAVAQAEVTGGATGTSRSRAEVAAAACTPITAANAASLGSIGQIDVGFGRALKWSPDSKTFWAVSRNEIVKIDAATLQKTTVYSGAAVVLDFNPATGLTAFTSDQKSIQLRDLFANQDKGTVTPSAQFGSASLAPDGQSIAVSLVTEIGVELRRTSDGGLVRKYTGFSTGLPVYAASFAPDGASLVWLARARVQLMDLATGSFRPALEHEDFVLDMSLEAGRLATAFGAGLRLWDPSTGAVLFDTRPSLGIFAVELSRDASLLFAGNKGDILVYQTTPSPGLVADLARPAAMLALAPNGCTLLASDANGTVVLLTPAAASGPAPTPITPVISPPKTGDAGLAQS